ncbi:uncharacterized protein LOC129599390 [Paramacrobiotus metropolitanus]|uniref:uncharacterized protein LOC129599390 n=1 Tax=Paramacrobiotus metropolitanus TaxID=2943436 RepID=UPI002446497A|nr:uncharacterized protein LOC129599390 [Paramacrobiotus metropolitanus]
MTYRYRLNRPYNQTQTNVPITSFYCHAGQLAKFKLGMGLLFAIFTIIPPAVSGGKGIIEAVPGIITAGWVIFYSAVALVTWALSKSRSSEQNRANCNSTINPQFSVPATPPGLFFYKVLTVFMGISILLSVASLTNAIVVLVTAAESVVEVSGLMGILTGAFFLLLEPLSLISAIYDIKHAGRPRTPPTFAMSLEPRHRTNSLLHEAATTANTSSSHYPQIPLTNIIYLPNVPQHVYLDNLGSRPDVPSSVNYDSRCDVLPAYSDVVKV